MNNMKKLFWLLPVLLTMLVTGCLKDDPNERTIVLMGTESEIQTIDSVIPSSLLVFVSTADSMSPATPLALPEGNTPPDIQGEYIFGPRDLYKNNGHQPIANDTVYLRFGGKPSPLPITTEVELHQGDILVIGADTLVLQADSTILVNDTLFYYPQGQHNRIVPFEIYGDIKEKDNRFELKKGDAFVMGSWDDFTLYYTIDYYCKEALSGAEFTLTRGYILTGKISDEGIEHAVMACANIQVEVTAPSPAVPNEAIEAMRNRIYIYRVQGSTTDLFGTAVRLGWVNL